MIGEKLLNLKRFFLTLIIAAVATPQMAVVNAQSVRHTRRTDVGWAAIARNGNPAPVTPQVEMNQNRQIADAAAIESQAADPKNRLVGSWIIKVSPNNSPAFDSLQTFNEDGTMTETSSLLPQLDIGPAHGVWEGKKNDYLVTFELFAFVPTGEAVGRLRVRGQIHLNNDDTLTADGVLDFIQPDGTVIPGVANTPFTGTRIKVVPAN
jgi:hypothetical protein